MFLSRQVPGHDAVGVLSAGKDSVGFTPYFFCLALPHGQPPNVTTVSIACRNMAKRFPFLALVQMGQRCSQKSGSMLKPLMFVFLQFTGIRTVFQNRRLPFCSIRIGNEVFVRLRYQ
jgi:hypothetical protein